MKHYHHNPSNSRDHNPWPWLDRKLRWISEPLSLLGRLFLRQYYGHMTMYLLRAFSAIPSAFRPGLVREQSIWQIFYTGIEILPVMMFIAFLIGSAVVLQALAVMPTLGFGNIFGGTMVAVIFRELSPVFTALFVAGRSGAALTTYIANMKVQSELDALESMGIDPVRYIVLPALIGSVSSLLVFNILFSLVSISGGLIFTTFLHWFNHNVPATQPLLLLNDLFKAMNGLDLAMLFIKPITFGILISGICSHKGLSVQNDPRAVPQVSSEAIVSSFFYVIMADILLSSIYIYQYLQQLQGLI